ncbi:hypothetical protein ID866_735 [Astraeus odoratus]|nr:hypothetical protein ID866_735 [Astraeus odoratus]
MAQLILPLSLFLGLLMTLGKLYTESEITVMHACGLSKAVLVKAAMILALFTGIVAAVNVMWAGPMSSRHQDEVLAEAKANPGMAALAQGQFQQATDGNSVLFIESVDGSKFNDVFLAQLRPKGNARPSVVVADSGQLSQRKDGSQVVTLNKGTRFEGTAMLRDFRITDFQNYQAIIGHQAVALDPTDTEQMDMRTLWNTDTDRARAEFHWRITLVFTVFMMALIVVPLSVVNPRQGRVLSMLPAMLLYLIYFLLQTSIRSNGAKGKLDPMVWTWSHLMQAFGVLDRYIGKTIFTTIMMTLFMLVSLSGIIKFVDQLKKAGQGSYDAMGAGMYTLLSVPKDVQIFFPMAALLGALLGLGMLAQRSELVVMQASGFTRMQVALSVMKTAIPLVLLTMAIGEWVAPQGEQMARNYRAQAMYGGSLLSTQQGLWAKDGKNFVYIERVKGDDELGGVSIYAFNDQRRLESVRHASSAKFDAEHKQWRLSQVDESDLTDPKQITGSQTVIGTWKTNLTPDKLGVVALDPDALSISGLHNYVKYLKSSGQDAGRYQLNMWSKIFQPMSVAVMMLMALSFIFGPLRSVPMGVRVVTGISFGFVFYVLDQIFGPLTLVYGIPPIIGALLPSASFFLISLWLLLKRS